MNNNSKLINLNIFITSCLITEKKLTKCILLSPKGKFNNLQTNLQLFIIYLIINGYSTQLNWSTDIKTWKTIRMLLSSVKLLFLIYSLETLKFGLFFFLFETLSMSNRFFFFTNCCWNRIIKIFMLTTLVYRRKYLFISFFFTF